MDKDCISTLIKFGSSDEKLAEAHKIAAQALKKIGVIFPKKGCAATLSALLQLSGIDVPMTFGAGKLAYLLGGKLNSRGWDHIQVGKQQPGDVGVCFDNKLPSGADHVYLVLQRIDDDKMMIVDNQRSSMHQRSAMGKDGKTATEYFLRAPGN